MAKLVDAPDFDSGDESLGGSSPSSVATVTKKIQYVTVAELADAPALGAGITDV